VVLNARLLTPQMYATIVKTHPGRVVNVSSSELLRLGLTRWVRRGGY
jgi:hypothetical protein